MEQRGRGLAKDKALILSDRSSGSKPDQILSKKEEEYKKDTLERGGSELNRKECRRRLLFVFVKKALISRQHSDRNVLILILDN